MLLLLMGTTKWEMLSMFLKFIVICYGMDVTFANRWHLGWVRERVSHYEKVFSDHKIKEVRRFYDGLFTPYIFLHHLQPLENTNLQPILS